MHLSCKQAKRVQVLLAALIIERKNMDSVFVLMGEAGEYDDYTNWVEGIFTAPEKALDYLRVSFNGIEILANSNADERVLYNALIHHGDDNYPHSTWYSIVQHNLNPERSELIY